MIKLIRSLRTRADNASFPLDLVLGLMQALLKILQCSGNYLEQVSVLSHAHCLTVSIKKHSFSTGTREYLQCLPLLAGGD